MGRRLPRCLFQKRGDFHPTKGKGIGQRPLAKVEKTSGNARWRKWKRHRALPDVYSFYQPKRAFHLRKRHWASPVAESSNDIGLGPMSIPKLNLPPETL